MSQQLLGHKMDWMFVDMNGLNKGRSRLFNFLDIPPLRNFFLAVNANPTPLDSVLGVYLVKTLLLRIGQGSRPLLRIGCRDLQIL